MKPSLERRSTAVRHRVVVVIATALTACGFDVPLGADDGGTCGATSVGGFGLDTTFGTCGSVRVDVGNLDNVTIGTQSLAVDAEGRAVLGVRGGTSGFRHLTVVRLVEDGGLDTSFGSNGAADVGVLTNDQAEAVRVQPDGRILVAGTTDDIFGEPFGIVGRVTSDGQPDLSFGFQNSGHQKLTNMTLNGSTCRGLVLRADGSMVCTGTAYATFPGPGDLRAVALDAAGQPTTVFTEARVDFAGGDELGAAGIELPDGKLLLPGRSGGDFALVRLEASGALDATFARVTVDFEGGADECFAVLAPGDGTAWCAGFATVGGARVGALARVTANGTLDASFGAGGRVTLPGWNTVYALHRLADGRVLLAGDAPGAGGLAQAFQLVDATGATVGPLVTLDLSTGDDSARVLALDASERLLVAGVIDDGPADDVVVHRFVDVSARRLGAAGQCSTSAAGPLLLVVLLMTRRTFCTPRHSR